LLRAAGAAVVLICLFSSFGTFAQQPPPGNPALTGTLRGVATAVSGEGHVFSAEGVEIKLTGPGTGTAIFAATSADDGSYKIENLPPGEYALTTSAPGFKPVSLRVTIQAGQGTVTNLRLDLQEVRQELEVHATAPVISAESAAPPAKLTSKQVMSAPVAEQKTQEELPLVPSVVRTPEGRTYIKGSSETAGMFEVDSGEAVDPVTGAFIIDVPIDAVESLEVNKAPFLAEDGGFSGGLTSVRTKAPLGQWHVKLNNVNPKLRAENGQIVGLSQAEPRLYTTGPLWPGKLNFSEAFSYEINKVNARGLAWPHNTTKIQGFDSYTTFQSFLSDRHILTGDAQIFPRRENFANINALLPEPASEDYGQKGFSADATDRYRLASGVAFTSMFRFLKVDDNAHSQGPLSMLVTPTGFGGNYFNDWKRWSDQEEAEESVTFPQKHFHGRHNLKVGVEVNHRNYDGTNVSRPVEILRADNSVAEQITFAGGGFLHAQETEITEFAQDHWIWSDQIALNLGLRTTSETIGEPLAPAPRLGLVYSPDKEGKTVFRAGAGVFFDRFPLLAGDYLNNPTRTVTFFDAAGNPIPGTTPLANLCGRQIRGGFATLSSCSDFTTMAYSTTWRLEVERQLTRQVRARVGYLYSPTFDVFVVNPTTVPTPGLGTGTSPALLLTNSGSLRYRELEATAVYVPNERARVSVTYLHSQAQGDLNTLSELFVPFYQPVIRANVFANLPSDVPNRLTALGTFVLPWQMTLNPAVDVHTGFPYSNVDVLQNYVGTPQSLRMPTFFSFDFSVYRDFFVPFHKGHKFRFGVFSVNTTGRRNPHEVYNNTASPYFGNFTGLDKRIDGIIISFAE
jgi:carboxypeptidase family protein